MSQYDRDYYAKNRDKLREKKRLYWYSYKNKEGVLEGKRLRHKKWYEQNKDKVQEKHRAYKAEFGHFIRMRANEGRLKKLEELAGRVRPPVCEICGGATRGIVFDHNHETGQFRGWICHPCNVILGLAKDSPEALRRLANYLEIHTGATIESIMEVNSVLPKLHKTNE